MRIVIMPPLPLCWQCARAALRSRQPRLARPAIASSRVGRQFSTQNDIDSKSESDPKPVPAEKEADEEMEIGAMSRRLQQATEEALFTGGRAGRQAVEDAGFSDELKSKLLGKISNAKFHAEHDRAIAAAGLDPDTMTSAGGTGSATAAAAAVSGAPWIGEEATEDAVLRMLNDARKPLAPGLRGKPKIPDPVIVDLRLRRAPTPSAGKRLSNAREKAFVYTDIEKTSGNQMSDKEREEYRSELRERFSPGSRALPSSFSGLAALANERIENAIARGQFQNIPRGPGVERDKRADNPFIDTTEYIMNKMIQRQDIVPPWIEKQQEVVRAAHSFRAHLRTTWRRHAARSIASRGGSLQEQMAQAERYARAEQVHNPRRRNVEQISVPTSHTDDPVMARLVEADAEPKTEAKAEGEAEADIKLETGAESGSAADIDMTLPYRNPQWEAVEKSYMELSVANLNALTRSYNLMAPELAKKPYFSLERELKACYSDVAPTLAQTIKERAVQAAKPTGENPGEAVGRRILERMGGGGAGSVRVYESKAPTYGFREMWRDVWRKN
ncbi:hypothetical protein F503_07171 [Ophiostoma piceae UAMH 11346]|uniref:DnaJ homologue subfamily C member 28 conserved domain-containing protein n=1 Tax=Ophiostoma piceae (strain UAMH 11346) TaxID=1262450 RepID=S3D7K2_OPHP1|nr:hypothetical protein F503_07171 [Ophiostoma piceae UAMH 11346]